ncbi:MAG: DUF4332 domain-containing protein [Candidatus Bathyarchaeota archaeon]|nr:DUF4332 domain-containing protein [Candidatus Bathyarchaeota archaeon]
MNPLLVVFVFILLLAALLYMMSVEEPEKPLEEEFTVVETIVPKVSLEKEEVKSIDATPPMDTEPEKEETVEPSEQPEDMDDLERLSGVGAKYRQLLIAVGITTTASLATQNPDELWSKLVETNKSEEIVKRPPPLKIVEAWIEKAKELY